MPQVTSKPTETTTDAAATPAAAVELDAITVTAQKREQLLRDVPISVSVITSDTLDRHGATDLIAVSEVVPGLRLNKGGQMDRLIIRGVGSGFDPGFEQAVATFVDGVYHGRSRQLRSTLFDVERVEVLKGPQSTYFGNNTSAGAINVTTRKPDGLRAINLYAEQELQDERLLVDAGITQPLSSKASLRLAGRLIRAEPYVENREKLDGTPQYESKQLGRVSLAWTPMDTVNIAARVDLGRVVDPGANRLELLECPPPAAYGMARGSCAAYLNANGGVVDDQLNNSTALYPRSAFDFHYFEPAATTTVDLDSLSFVSVTAWSQNRHSLDGSPLGTPVRSPFRADAYAQPTLFDERLRQFTQELRIQPRSTERFDYQAGVFLLRSKLNSDATVGFYNRDFGAMAQPDFRAGDLIATLRRSNQTERSWSLFGSVSVPLADRLQGQLGLRYSSVGKDVTKTADIGTTAPRPTVVSFVPGSQSGQARLAGPLAFNTADYPDLSRQDHRLLPSASVLYKIAPRIRSYASYTRGFKSGGYSFNGTARPELTGEFAAESADAYELGLDLRGKANRWSVRAALFRAEYSNLQEGSAIIVPGTTTFVYAVGNSASSVSQGLELDLNWRVAGRLKAQLQTTLLDAHYDQYQGAPCTSLQLLGNSNCTQDLSGRRRSGAPSYSARAGLLWSRPVRDGVEFTSSFEAYASGRYFLQANLDPELAQGAYIKFDASFGLDFPRSGLSVSLIGRNLADERTTSFRQTAAGSPGSQIGYSDPPRTVSLAVGARW